MQRPVRSPRVSWVVVVVVVVVDPKIYCLRFSSLTSFLHVSHYCLGGSPSRCFLSCIRIPDCSFPRSTFSWGKPKTSSGCDFFERVHMYACTNWNSPYVLSFFCFRWPSLFFPDFLVILMAGRVSVCAHVRMCSPLILAGCCLHTSHLFEVNTSGALPP